MLKKYPTYKSMRNEYSLLRYSLRAKVDDSLHSDVTAFLMKHDTSLDNLVTQLLENQFASDRIGDTSYPL